MLRVLCCTAVVRRADWGWREPMVPPAPPAYGDTWQEPSRRRTTARALATIPMLRTFREGLLACAIDGRALPAEKEGGRGWMVHASGVPDRADLALPFNDRAFGSALPLSGASVVAPGRRSLAARCVCTRAYRAVTRPQHCIA